MQASQICLLASREAKGGPGMISIAGQYLNLILEDLYLNRDLKINRVTATINFTTGTYGPFPLEANYLRTYDLFYPLPTSGGATQTGLTQFLRMITMEQFDAEFKDPSLANYPYEFATDLSIEARTLDPITGDIISIGGLFMYPQTSGTIQVTHRYMLKRDTIVTPETSSATPWFNYTDYLVKATAARMMGVTGDDRQSQYLKDCEDMLRPYLIMAADDEQQTVHEIKLDPRRFHFSKGLKPTKASPF